MDGDLICEEVGRGGGGGDFLFVTRSKDKKQNRQDRQQEQTKQGAKATHQLEGAKQL
jgi:hypothetical protein